MDEDLKGKGRTEMSDLTNPTDVCIVGGGPAGMLLGLLLVQKGLNVIILESHKDFAREYRGEVLMPRFIQMMRQIKLADYLETFPHLKLEHFEFFFKERCLARVTFKKISPEVPYALWMPQPILLDALYQKAKTYPNFNLRFGTTVRELIKEGEQVCGVEVETNGAVSAILARVVVGTDGRFSVVRKLGGFEFEEELHTFDLLWFTINHRPEFGNTVRAFFSLDHNYLVLPKYPDQVQCGLVLSKGAYPALRKRGIEALKKELLAAHPLLHEFAGELKDFSGFSLLEAKMSYVRDWAKDGCLLVGDSAHTCSPAGAIGVSVAAGTALVAADVLVDAFQANDFSAQFLGQVQARRAKDVRMIQTIQKRFTGALFVRFPFQLLSLALIFVFGRLGIMARLQRRLAVMAQPLKLKNF